MDDLTIQVRYSCPLCGLVDTEIPVKARGEEDVVTWMEETVIIALANDHNARSPFCKPKQLHNIMIPIQNADRVGGPTLQ